MFSYVPNVIVGKWRLRPRHCQMFLLVAHRVTLVADLCFCPKMLAVWQRLANNSPYSVRAI